MKAVLAHSASHPPAVAGAGSLTHFSLTHTSLASTSPLDPSRLHPTHPPLPQRNDKEISVELSAPRPDGSTSVTVPTSTERESSDLSHIKLRNLDYERHATGGRGGVDDLISLTHLHEPAILDVLALRYAKDCIYSAWP